MLSLVTSAEIRLPGRRNFSKSSQTSMEQLASKRVIGSVQRYASVELIKGVAEPIR
jgi:hypothetical protein